MEQNLSDVERIRDAFQQHDVEYLFIGKIAAILQGYSDTTQDADVFVESTAENCQRLTEALKSLGIEIDAERKKQIESGRGFIQFRGAIDIDVVYEPDGIETYKEARSRGRITNGCPVCNLEDIIKSKEAANRQKDRETLPRLKRFQAYQAEHPTAEVRPLPRRPEERVELFPPREAGSLKTAYPIAGKDTSDGESPASQQQDRTQNGKYKRN